MNIQEHEEKAGYAYVYSLAEAGIHKNNCEGYDWVVVVNGDNNYFDPFPTLEQARSAALYYIEERADYYDGVKSYALRYEAWRKDDEVSVYAVSEDADDAEECRDQYYEIQHQNDCQHIARYGY